VSERGLDEPLTRPPLVLLQQHTTELDQRVRASIVERQQDALAIVGATTPASSASDFSRNERVGSSTSSMSLRTSSSGMRRPARYIEAATWSEGGR
jgi:hypothetical protein